MRKILALMAAFALVLGGCGKEVTSVAEPETVKEPPVNPQSEVLAQAEEAGLLDSDKEKTLTAQDAAARVTESLDQNQYTAELTDIQLQVGGDEKSMHDFYVFEVKDTAGGSIGQVAVDKETGEKYSYQGEGILDDYSSFPLYDPAVDAVCDWAGSYKGPAGITLDVLQGDESSFEFTFSDETTGNARISGNTAKSEDGTLNFLFSDGVITVAGGTVTGNYTLAAAEKE